MRDGARGASGTRSGGDEVNPASRCDLCGQFALYPDVEWFRDATGSYECDDCIDAMAAYFEARYPQ